MAALGKPGSVGLERGETRQRPVTPVGDDLLDDCLLTEPRKHCHSSGRCITVTLMLRRCLECPDLIGELQQFWPEFEQHRKRTYGAEGVAYPLLAAACRRQLRSAVAP